MHAPLEDATLRARARTLSDLLRHVSLTLPASREAAAQRVISRLARNALSVGNHYGLAGSALFRGVAMLNHSCDPNAFVWFCFGNTEGRVVAEVRASRKIQPGEEICIDVSPRPSYVSKTQSQTSLISTLTSLYARAWLRCCGMHVQYLGSLLMTSPERREELRQQFMFSCTCARCTMDLHHEVASESCQNASDKGLEPADSAQQYSVVKAQFDQARSLWLRGAEGDVHAADSSLIQARALLKKLVVVCEQELEQEHKALQLLLVRARDTLGSVLISLGLYAEARDCLLEYVASVRLLDPLGTAPSSAATDHGVVGRQASLPLAMRVLDLSMLEAELGNEHASRMHAKGAWAELVCLAGDAGAREIFAYRAVPPPP
jgi:hypothetical protein